MSETETKADKADNEQSGGAWSDEAWGDDPFADPPIAPLALQDDADGYEDDNAEEDDDTYAERVLPVDKLSFDVTDAASASWVIRKIVESRARQERIRDWA